MWGLLCLLIQHIVVGVADKRSVVRMEEHLVRNLEDVRKRIGVRCNLFPLSAFTLEFC